MLIPASSWTPDQAEFGSSGMTTATNCLPGSNSYVPMPSLQAQTGTIDAYARGAIDIRDKDLNVYQYVGNETKLYELNGDTWTDVSLGGGYSTATEEKWSFALYKNTLIATNWTNDPQSITIGGANFADLTTSLRARNVARVDQHVVFANTYDLTDGNVPDRVWTSAYDDPTDYTPNSATGSSVRDLGGGPIEKIFGGEFGVILCRDRVFRMQWVGAPTWFQIDETITGAGAVAPGACCQLGSDVYTFSQHGFFRIVDGSQAIPIGTDQRQGQLVDDFMFNDLDFDYLYRMSCVSDPQSGRIFWAYPGTSNNAGQPNRIICYDSKLNKWSLINQEVDIVWAAGGIGVTLEGLDTYSSSIDDLAVSLDSTAWKGDGVLNLAAFDSTQAHGFFNGSPMTATFVSPEMEFFEDRHAMMLRHTPVAIGGTVTSRIGYRNSLRDAVSYTASASENRWGRIPRRIKARYHRIEETISGEWEHFVGWQIGDGDARPTGRLA